MLRRLLAVALSTLVIPSCTDGGADDDSDASAGHGGASATGGRGGTGGTSGGDGGVPSGGGGTEMQPYANVTAVSASGEPGAYTFSVSIESSDIDCSQYADWWEVVSEDGALVYRRILEHSHTDENGTTDADAPGNTFTRPGGPVDVLADEMVVVRAHMSNGGYNGAAMRGNATDGFVEAPDVGSDFAAELESDEPLPVDCAF